MTSALRGEGGSRIAQFCGRIVLIGCVNAWQRGGGGPEMLKISVTSFMDGTLARI